MVTGDARETAESIAHELGFFDRGVDEALSGTPHRHTPTRQGLKKLSVRTGDQNQGRMAPASHLPLVDSFGPCRL